MRVALIALSCALLLAACATPAPPAPEPAAPTLGPPEAPNLLGAMPREDDWRELLKSNPGQETLDFCIALAGRGVTALEQASGRACLANIALLGCPEGEQGRCADAALVQIEVALELAPEARRLHLGRLRILLDAERAGDLDAALLDSLDRRAGDARDVPVWLGYAVELIELRNLRAAAAFTEALRTRFPDDPQVLASLGACLTDLGRLGRAAEILEHGIDIAPDDASLNWSMAWHHQRSGRSAAAKAYFEEALARAPDAETLGHWGCEYGRLLEQAADLSRACSLQQQHCADGASAICVGRLERR